MRQLKYIFVVFIALFWQCMAGANEFPKLTGPIVDEAGVLSIQQKEQIEKVLARDKQNQIVLVILSSLRGQEIEEYANELFRYWKLGDANRNNGVLIAIAPNEQQARIEVGYGLEGALTDAESFEIMRRDIIPYAKTGDYAMAAFKGTQAVINELMKEPFSPTIDREKDLSDLIKFSIIPIILLLLFFVILIKFIKRGIKNGATRRDIIKFLSIPMGFIFLVALMIIAPTIFICLFFAFAFILISWNPIVSILKSFGITHLFGFELKKINMTYSVGPSIRKRSSNHPPKYHGGGGSSGGGASGRW